MKTTDSSKQSLRYDTELIDLFSRQSAEDHVLHWRIGPFHSGRTKTADVELSIDGATHKFQAVYKLQPSIGELAEILNLTAPDARLLLITPELSPRVLEFCRNRGISAVDLNGRAYLRGPGLLVERPPIKGRHFRFELEPRNVFVGKSCQIIRTLLTDRDKAWTQSELVVHTRASSGLVSRIVSHLLLHGFAEKISARELRLTDPIGLVDAWIKADDLSRRVVTSRYSAFATPGVDLAKKICEIAKSEGREIAFTQWIAGWLRFPYTEPPVVSAYVSALPSDTALASLQLREVPDAGVVWLHVPQDEGVFLETQSVENLPLTTDAQIVVDLAKTGLRGPDQAAALKNWEGFCRREVRNV